GILGADGATYKAIEFDGSTVRNMEVWERLTLSNMTVEAGAKVGLIPTDGHTQRYLTTAGRGREFKVIEPDDDAVYERTIELDAKQLQPMVALPHAVDNVKRLDEVSNTKIDLVFIGSCTNTRLEDLHIAAKILKGRRINSHTRLVVTPASMKVYLEASRDGTLSTLTEAGAVITPSGCGMCFGALGGVPADGERVFSTSNRNFPGRMGNPKAFTYLGSPAVAAVTAVKGEISDPSEFL
ncbi:MAG: aconitase family protein, partial [Candidatus Bathyarchaeia archaeon]